MKALKPMLISGREVLPLVEGGKGISATNGLSSGAWAAAGGVGTVSCVNADSYDEHGNVIPQIYRGRTRRERHDELVQYAIDGGITQVREAHEVAGGEGRIHINVLWEMGGAERVLKGVLDRTRDLVHGITCGAGMPYRLSEIAAHYKVYYHPIVSSGRAFRALWKRAYRKYAEWLGSVVYEDPWRAGGHNGLSNSEDPETPEDPYPRVLALRQQMREFGLDNVPIVMAGGVWYLRDWEDWIDNPELGPIAFQYGTRPLLTKESPIPEAWKQRLLDLRKGDVSLHAFSPTGFYSSAVRNDFLKELEGRSERQIAFSTIPVGELGSPLLVNRRELYVAEGDRERALQWMAQGFTETLKTPEHTLIFVTPEKVQEIRKDQADCMGCLSQCQFSNWADNEKNSTGRKADPRSFCIQKTLQDIAHDGDVENNLMFAGHGAYNFATDPFYSNGFVPSVRELVDRIMTGD
jgi:NAD(P)H-dependent flavin oxidoreductase YrpB (nitropropane dioxygenase family)